MFGAVGEFACSLEIDTISYLLLSFPVNLAMELFSVFAAFGFLLNSVRSIVTPSNSCEIVLLFVEFSREEAMVIIQSCWVEGLVIIEGGQGRTLPRLEVEVDI